MKVKDIIEKQEEYVQRKEIIETMYKFKKDFYELYQGTDVFTNSDRETMNMIYEFQDKLNKDVQRLRKQLSEMEV